MDTLKLYLAGVPGISFASGIAVTVLFAVLAVMCFWSVHRIRSSAVLAGMEPPNLYLISEGLLIGCFLGASAGGFMTALRFRQVE